VEHLVARGDRVRVLDNLSTGRLHNLRAIQGRIQFIRGTVTDPTLVRDAVQGCDLVFHLAALPSVPRSVEDPIATHAVCATGSTIVLDCARLAGVRRVIYSASSSAYGGIPGVVRREEDPVAPLSPYAAAKVTGEFYCQAFWATFGLETVCLRLFNVFGPRQRADSPYAAVIPRFIEVLSQATSPVIFGDGKQSRDFTYVENVIQAFVKAAVAPSASGKVFNVGNGGSITLLELLNQLNGLLGTHIQPDFHPARPSDVRYSQADLTKSCAELGYEPLVSFRDGLRRTVEAYLATVLSCQSEAT
jgi:UDP-glucose 4-epimerase